MHQEPDGHDERAIAVVGVSCRLPGGINAMDDLWKALREGRDLVTEMPAHRFAVDRFVNTEMPRPGKSYTAAGGFLDDIAGFDAAYFGISPKEAAHMDPQHRLLLELSTEALDDAGIDPDRLAGSDTAVYVGISDASYAGLQVADPRSMNAYTMSGTASSIAANRLSYAFDLHGPSMAVDTACSSSLVALDRACHTLWEGTSRTALCGGANILLSPFHYVGFCQASMLSVRGRSSPFSADADGFVRSEGGGMVVLKRLPDALADGDRIHGVILGSASNCDGRTMGLALPSAEAQEDLLRRVYAQAGVHPDELVYFEAHGTGTPVGDPLEARAIGQALGMRRITGPLPIGSVKSNVGHLEPASGMAGLCKALLVLRHRTIPASLNAEEPNPVIDFTGLGIDLVTGNRALTEAPRPVVGVNSFGFGGANAHVVLTGAAVEPRPKACPMPREGLPVLVSARTKTALAESSARMAERLTAADADEFYDIAYTSCLRRGRHEYRACVLAPTADEAAQRLTSLAESGEGAAVEGVRGGRVALVFSGNGSQWAGMGADLMVDDAVFRQAVEDVDSELAPLLGWSVAEYLTSPTEDWRLTATEVAQPLLFAVQLALTETLRDQGVEPAMVLGHSVGEVAAACTAGALTLTQAAQVIAVRSQAQAATAGTGRMAAIGLGPDRAAGVLQAYEGRLEIAGVNSAKDVTVAGDADALSALGGQLERDGVFFRELDLDYAFHSRTMDPQQATVTTALKALRPGPAEVPFYSTVTGCRIAGTDLDGGYWWRNVREPVAFASAVDEALTDGADIFLEIGPHPVLRTYLRRITQARPQTASAVLPTLRRDTGGPGALATARAAVLAAGARTDWTRYFSHPGRVTELPAYPWQRDRHWAVPEERVGGPVAEHPLLGSRVPAPTPLWSGPVEPARVPWLADHRVAGSVVMPATGYAEMALAAGHLLRDAPAEVEHLDISSALVVPWADASAVQVQVALNPDDGVLLISSTDEHGGEPRPHARARVRTLLASRPGPLDPDRLRERCPRRMTGEEHYTKCEEAGLGYGPAFRVLTELHVGDKDVLAHYTHEAPGAPYTAHPALLDGALQAGSPLLAGLIAQGHAYLPAAIGAVRVWATPAPSGVIAVRERSRTDHEVCWDITVADPDGTVTAQLDGCRLRRFAGSRATPLTVQHTVLRAAPHDDEPCSAPSPVRLPEQVINACGPAITEARTAWRELRYGSSVAHAVDLYAGELATALASLLPDPSATFTWGELVEHGMQKRHLRLLKLMQPAMARRGRLRTGPDGRHHLTVEPACPEIDHATFAENHPQYAAELALATHHAAHLTDVLRGLRDPMELLTDEASAKLLEQFYDIAPFSHFHNRLAQALLREIVRTWPADRPLRILEVGAGTGGLTAALLPLLPADRTRYCFTDASPFFFSRARSRFAAHDFVEYRAFNLDTDPAEQGLVPRSFDLVVAGNALHTGKDLALAVRHVAGLLAPGGALLAIETHRPEILAPFFGTLDSFYSNNDTTLRPRSLLLPREEWPGLLQECGFAHVSQTGDDESPAREDASVLLATVPTDLTDEADDDTTPAAPAARTDTVFLVASETPDELPLAAELTGTLTAWDGKAAEATLMPGATEEWDALLARADEVAQGAAPAVVMLLGEPQADDPDAVVARAAERAEALRTCAAALEQRHDGSSRTELWVVTRPSGAVETGLDAEQPADAAVWAMARCLANEQPDTQARRLSLHRSTDVGHDARRLARELCAPEDEDEIVLAAQGRFVPREQHRPATRPATRGLPYTVQVRNPGLSYELAWQEMPRPEPGPGEVLVEVRATALNYRDIMQSVGLLPAEAVEGTAWAPGIECAGVVVACGDGVPQFKPGDRVAGMAPASLGSYTVTVPEGLFPLPDDITFTEAATMPVAYSTVLYSLGTLARLQPGETVLVHGAAGGVGLAAWRYANARGAEVIATAGSDLKRNCLRALGLRHVLDSRSLDFAEQVRAITEDRGVDVVLNSLAGEAITRSLELLRPGGRFLELGKRDFYENKPLLLRPFINNIAFFGVDLTKVTADRHRLAELVAQFDDPALRDACRPLPHTVFPAARIQEAFTLLQHSRHIGKVVVTFDPLDEPPLVEPLTRSPRLDPSGTYLVTGGTGGFGAATAEWLADLGARRIVLVSRRGPDAPEADAVLTALRDRDVQATAYAADAADLAAMTELVARIDAQGHPLRGVVHAAMHLDDDALVDLDRDRLAAVLRPKIGGAAVLDRLTRDRDIDLFLMYSSGTAMIGNIKQAPYAAGNLYLEALVRRRRRTGRPGLAIAWGALADAGYVARNQLAAALASLGLETVGVREAFDKAESLLQYDAEVAGVMRCDWARMRSLLPLTAGPRLAGLIPAGGATQDGREDLFRRLRQLPPDEALTLLTESIAALIAEVLEMAVTDIDVHRPVDSLGLDSLMAAELLVKLQQGFDIEIPPMELMRSARGTIAELAQAVHLRLGLAHSVEPAAAHPAPRAEQAEEAEEAEEAVVLPRQTSPSSGRPTVPPSELRLPVAAQRSDEASRPSAP
ncbi:SDR family NAD(P)-dependent oxidoreductase [Streptomyces sp. AC550_RSS872]|uniref:SDR family NAD(P)-dependent oxidoreductase n=1 Tax=Streptomyces sp. AC550_RSS872 TaxID=2823689 RepID=UPI0027E57C1C|nr:SDR family NAD(P)-dependent oxidoreductase [Streptomyces sp. AC550_RSS872]